MAGREFQMAFSIGARLQGQFGSAFKSAQTSVVALQSRIESLNKKQGDINAYLKQQAAIDKTRDRLSALQKEYEIVKNAMGKNGEASVDLQTKELRLRQQIDGKTESLAKGEQKLQSMGNALQKAGYDTNNLSRASEDLSQRLESLKGEQEEAAQSAEKMGQSMADSANAMAELVAAAGLVKVLQSGYEIMKQCSQAAIEYETSMAAVKRTVGGSEAFLRELGGNFKELSTTIPLSTSELAGIATTAGQLGIAQDKVQSFTEVMAKLATTTDLSADSAATMLAQFANITGLTDYERLGSVVAELGDATATTASKVVEMSQGMAASASQAGMSSVDIMAISASLGSLGIEAQAGSTSMSTLISTLYKAVETGDGLTEFASVANMTADQFKQAWGDNAVGALNAFIQGLNDTERNGKSAIVILDELGITNVRQTKAILGLASAGDLLSNTLAQAGNAWNQNTALTAKASVMYETTEAKLTMLSNATNNLKIAVGDALTPAIGGTAAAITNLMKPITAFIQKNPTVIRAITAGVGVIGLATAAITGWAAATRLATKLHGLFAASMTASLGPIMAFAAAIGGLVALGIILNDVFKNSQQSMEELDAEFDNLNADFKKQSHIRSLCAEYNQLQNELIKTKTSFTGLENQDDINVIITASALATLIPKDFMNPNAEGIKLTAEQVADLVAAGFMMKEDEGIVLTAKQTADLVASGFLKPDDEGIMLKAGQIAELVSAGFMKPDDQGITLKAGQTADLIAAGFLKPDDAGITLTAKQTHDLLSKNFLSEDDTGILLEAQQIADKYTKDFLAEDDTGITLTAQQTKDLVAAGFLNPDDEGITLTAGQTASLLSSGFMSKGDAGITLKAGQTADLLASGFLKPDDQGIILKATQSKDLLAAGFIIDPNEKIPISATALKELKAQGFIDGSTTIQLSGKADATITVDQFLTTTDRIIELTADVTNLGDVQSALASLQTEADSLKTKAATAKTDLTSAQTALADMEGRQIALEARLTHAGTESAKSYIQKAIEDQTVAIEAQRAKVAELKTAYAASSTQYTITQAAVDELSAKHERLSAIQGELADATDGTVSAIERETAAISAQIEQADKLAAAEQARLRADIYSNVTKQAQQYTKAVQETNNVTQQSAQAYDTYNRSLKYAGMTADEVNAAYQNLLHAFDEKTAAPDFVPFSEDAKEAAAEIQALAYLMGQSYSDLTQYADGSVSFAEAFGYVSTNDSALLAQVEMLSQQVALYGDQLKAAEAIQQTFIGNLSDGVSSGAITAEEAYTLISTSLTNAGLSSEYVQTAITQLNQALGIGADESENMAEGMENLGVSAAEVNSAMQPILDKMNELGKAYSEAYDAAYKSMESQFKLFEQVDQITGKTGDDGAKAVQSMIDSLISQAQYMAEYKANLEAVKEMKLSDGLISQLSDGSKESAQILADIVASGAESIDDLNIAFKAVEEGKDAFASTVAEMETDFATKMAALQTDIETAVSQMKMSSEAASAGAATVQAFADAAAGNVGAVTAAFRAVSKAAKLALKVDLNPDGYASGTESAERGFRWVGERGPELMWFNGGEQVMNAQDSRNFMRQAESAEPVQALSDRRGDSHYNIEIKPEFNITGAGNQAEMEALVQQQTERMRDIVEEVLSDIESDRERSAYT